MEKPSLAPKSPQGHPQGHPQNHTDEKYGVMICGHGSRSQSAVNEFAVLAQKLTNYLPNN